MNKPKLFFPEGTNVDTLNKEQILNLIGSDVIELVKSARKLSNENSIHSFKHYFKEEYQKKHNVKDIDGNYLSQERSLILALKSLDQMELNEELYNDVPDTNKIKKISQWIIELNSLSKALAELSEDKRKELAQAFA